MTDFIGFRFGNFHTKDLNLLVVSSSNRYDKNLLPELNDYTSEIVGSNGNYYFGSTFKNQEFTVNLAFDSIKEKDWRKMSQIFATDILKDLVFDELPYKTYRAKVKQKPNFKYICFKDRKTGERIYKGEGSINFICYFPFAFGFNKYIVRAADYYLTQPPEKIIKEHYNVEGNMELPWKGGYPTFEQVQKGELYFNTPDGEKSIIDVRRYWNNVPKWAETSKLLTTPTLDFDQNLIYLPQYSKVNYINMDTGLNNENALIGSRILVYNPGDLPIEFKMKLDNNERTFWTERGNHFQIRRFNVQRLSIPNAVDWVGLLPQEESDEDKFKYGQKYFKRTVRGINNNGAYELEHSLLPQHPNYTYIAEPIPRQKLGHYIRLFYWQSSRLFEEGDSLYLNFKDGLKIAHRYEELYKLCIDDEERYELYWKTLKEGILQTYSAAKIFDDSYNDPDCTIEQFIYNFIFSPQEYIDKNSDLDSKEIDFNISSMPQYITEDFLEIQTDGITNSTLHLDTSKRMCYNIEESEDFYEYIPKKTIYNDNIVKGKWFNIPTGWSLIEVTPVVDKSKWGKKRWRDARPFDWGYSKEEDRITIKALFDKIYPMAEQKMLEKYDKDSINFRLWYADKIKLATAAEDKFGIEFYGKKEEAAEYEFLKLLHEYWRINRGVNGTTGDISEWWWYANHYIWANFPPLYWAYADILNKAKIKYVPLYY